MANEYKYRLKFKPLHSQKSGNAGGKLMLFYGVIEISSIYQPSSLYELSDSNRKRITVFDVLYADRLKVTCVNVDNDPV